MKFGFLKLIHGESNSGPLGYGHDVISNRLCAHCQKLKPAHQLTIFDSRESGIGLSKDRNPQVSVTDPEKLHCESEPFVAPKGLVVDFF